MRSPVLLVSISFVLMAAACAPVTGQSPQPAKTPATQPAATVGKMPHLQIDAASKKIRIECQPCVENMNVGLEFFCVTAGSNEYESVLRTTAKPSDIHFALLSLGLQPGTPVKYSESMKKTIPPSGPPLQITCEFERDGKPMAVPAYRLMRNITSKKEGPPFTWIFAGSRVMEDGAYAADATGYVVSVLNNELTVIDIPTLASRALETRELERNADLLPPPGSTVWMVLEPAGDKGEPASAGGRVPAPADPISTPTTQPDEISNVHIDQNKIDDLKARWKKAVAPHSAALREAAQTHYEVINSMRREQQRLIDEADRIQRAIDDLEKDYQDMTTPRPEPVTP